MISASHNPPAYNGIKFFSREGMKLPDALEDEMEAALGETATDVAEPDHGRILPFADARERYVEHLVGASLAPLAGMRVVVDCANGSASAVAPDLLRRLGADVTAIHADPDGTNINDGCGALHPEVVAAEVVRLGADAGVSHDGDADRALFADAEGNVIDGDQVLAACAVGLHDAGELAGDTVVATVMSNIGFERAMTEHGIRVVRTKVGDRYVLEEMERGGFVLGGEQSGHVIFRRHATTGDGLLTAVRFLSLAAATGATVGELAGVMRRYPQVHAERAGRGPGGGRVLDGGRVGGRATPKPLWGTAGACCCAPAAPSRWSASWSRPRPRPTHARTPRRSPRWSAPSRASQPR